MAKIKSIQLHNYKFFNEQEPINLEVDGECKHLLLYGENGSGKSSIFWGLHTLFESSLKEDEDIQKYFKHRDESAESLVNIYAEKGIRDGIDDYNSFIEVITNEELNNVYRVSLFDLDINQNENAQLINQTSEFLSYKDLFEFQRFWNGRPMNLAQIFISSVLPFLEFPESELIKGGEKVKITNAFQKWWEIRQVGPGKTVNHKGNEIQVYKTSPENIAFNKFVNEFNKNIEDLIDFINVNAPLIIKQLGYEIDFNLKYIKPFYKKGDTRYECKDFEIEFLVTSYLGEPITIYRPQSFLNEAKISAIALAIKLSVLKRKFNDRVEIPKFIVFDDLMISLDMNNRDRLIDYLLNPINSFTSDYQIFFLTHDKNLFDFIGYKINQWDSLSNWKIKELYSGSSNDDSKKEYPVIIDGELDFVQKAKKYFDIKDYTSCSIYIRKELEKIVNERLPDELKYKSNGEFLSLQTLWKNMVSRYSSLGENVEPLILQLFEQTKLMVLNPQAHFQSISMPIYKLELEKGFRLIQELRTKCKIPNYSYLLTKGMILEFRHPSYEYSFKFELLTDFRILGNIENSILELPKCKVLHWQFNGVDFCVPSNGVIVTEKEIEKIQNRKDDRIDDILRNLKKDTLLNITSEMFIENLLVENSIWSFNEVIEKANIKDKILAL
jgi:energy-coupling factor transporter ATP-binding protein EcfA2